MSPFVVQRANTCFGARAIEGRFRAAGRTAGWDMEDYCSSRAVALYYTSQPSLWIAHVREELIFRAVFFSASDA